VDTHRLEGAVTEFSRLGFEKFFPVSAIHGEGIQNLMDAATAFLPTPSPETAVQEVEVLETDGDPTEPAPRKKGPLRLAIVGRPNVGKSSIINARHARLTIPSSFSASSARKNPSRVATSRFWSWTPRREFWNRTKKSPIGLSKAAARAFWS
jgi:ribosome biogenesis GTPase A